LLREKVLERRKGPTLVRFLLLFELLLELGAGLLEVVEVILEEPHLSSLLLFQLVKLPLEIDVLRQLFRYALLLGSKLLVTMHDYFQLL
jgi:hypothetical protein